MGILASDITFGFVFRAEDGIRDFHVTGVQTCALPISPDLTDHALGELLEVCASHGVAGVIATNTTLSRDGLAPGDGLRGAQAGGLSGRPLAPRAREVVTFVSKRSELPVIGVGGILTPEDAWRLFDAGASLVQLYTGLVYAGPALVRRIVRGLR